MCVGWVKVSLQLTKKNEILLTFTGEHGCSGEVVHQGSDRAAVKVVGEVAVGLLDRVLEGGRVGVCGHDLGAPEAVVGPALDTVAVGLLGQLEHGLHPIVQALDMLWRHLCLCVVWKREVMRGEAVM